jgi:UDP-2,4-diacetamido-2,4,6-trideoxy-beta-L-altropyranose hydrolase
MNVFILTEGGRDMGLGHITRCTSVYQAFEEFYVQPWLIVNGDEAVRDLLKDKNCEVFDWLNDRKTLFATIENADIVFIDSYLADNDLYKKISNVSKTAVYFDDNIRIDYPQGVVLNGGILAEQMPYPRREGVTYLVGARYAPLRKEFWDAPAKPIRNKIETIMITFGGTDVHGLTAKVLKLLIDTCPKMLKKVIIAKGFQNTTEIEKLRGNNTELEYYPDAAGMKNVMLESDIAISAGGQTLYELARIGVPTVVVTVADNQSNNVHGWEKVGFIEYAGRWEDDGLIDTIAEKINLLKSKSLRKNRCELGCKVIDGRGSFRIVSKLLSAFYRPRLTFRDAALADADKIFNLANEEVVRKNSFEGDPIDWDNHLKWLTEKLGDSNCLFLIVDYQGEFTGQVRFDVIPKQAEAIVSISLQKYMRGLGVSPFIISRSIEELINRFDEVKVVRAYIKDGNIASVRAFEDSGFKFVKKMQIKGHESRVYEKAIGNGHP